MAVSSYGSATKTSGVVRIVKDLDLDLTGRDVMLVEDIVDCGLTLSYLRKNLQARSPASLEVCALLAQGRSAEASSPTSVRGVPHPARLRGRVRPRRGRAVPQPARRSAPTWARVDPERRGRRLVRLRARRVPCPDREEASPARWHRGHRGRRAGPRRAARAGSRRGPGPEELEPRRVRDQARRTARSQDATIKDRDHVVAGKLSRRHRVQGAVPRRVRATS